MRVRPSGRRLQRCEGGREPGAFGPLEGSLEPKAIFNINTNSKEFSQGREMLLSSCQRSVIIQHHLRLRQIILNDIEKAREMPVDQFYEGHG